jgi:uncharacterized protein YfaS (alpha-2-macroglobulin family)
MTNVETDTLFLGGSVEYTIKFKDHTALFDPSTVTITVYDASGIVQTQPSLTLTSLVRIEQGVYTLIYSIPSTAAAGIWKLKVTAEYTPTGLRDIKEYYFQVETP